MHHDFHRENSTRLMLGSIVGEDMNDTLIHSVGYDSLASLLLREIEEENNNINDVEMPEIKDDSNDVEVDYSSSSENSSSTLTGIDGYTSQMDYPFKDSGLPVYLFGSCNGILCLWYDGRDDQDNFFCLWNPSTNEYKRICEAPKRYSYSDITLYAFVYDPTADDYKFLIAENTEMESLVRLYSLGSDSWRRFLTPYTFVSPQKSGLLFNGDLHWLALQTHYTIVSLGITNEIFNEIQPPSAGLQLILVGVLEDCLCVLDEDDVIDIWAMQVYGDPESWTKRYTITNEIITRRVPCHCTNLRFMWSFKDGVILFTDAPDLVLYDPKYGSAIVPRIYHVSAENYSESLVSLNSGTYVGKRTANSSYTELGNLKHRNSVLEARITELEAYNAELRTKLHESQVAQKELEESKKDDVEEIAMTKKNGRKRKTEYQYDTRWASKAVASMSSTAGEITNFEDESLTVQQRAEKEQAELVLLQTGGTLEPYQIKEGSKTHSRSKDTYQTMTVKMLRDLLKERGLMVKGKKDELIARLRGL
ncbi:uncharacterized protein LOC113302826 [Papaver somniferum]|nr:uncharacterized protein LOC113302826 [Papaver somniferum]